jgi:8-oxo-dGTP pyrophosphatase MutT (NUDIX family)
MSRIEHYNDPTAPVADSLVPAASAVVVDDEGRVLLQRRLDNGLWSLPGGTMEVGETIRQCVIREVKEETGLDIDVVSLVGIYSDPRYVIEYANGEVRQQFSVCFYCRPRSGILMSSPESIEVAWFDLADLPAIELQPSIALRIQHALSGHLPHFD